MGPMLRSLVVLSIVLIAVETVTCGKMDFLGKKYKLEKSENFDEFMKAIGVGYLVRKMGGLVSPTVEVTKDENGVYTMQTESTFKSQTLKFKNGEEFDEETPDGRNVKSVITFEGNKMIHKSKGEKPTVITRTFGDKEMTAIMQVDDIVCTRVYKLVD